MIFLRSAVLAILAMIQSSPGMSGFRGLSRRRQMWREIWGQHASQAVRPMTTTNDRNNMILHCAGCFRL
jgi:hypothetical protein